MAGERGSDYVGRGGGRRRENWKRTLSEVEKSRLPHRKTTNPSAFMFRNSTFIRIFFKFGHCSLLQVSFCSANMECVVFLSPLFCLDEEDEEQTGATQPGSYFLRCNFRANNSACYIRTGWLDTRAWVGKVFVAKNRCRKEKNLPTTLWHSDNYGLVTDEKNAFGPESAWMTKYGFCYAI